MSKQDVFRAWSELLRTLQQDFPQWQEEEIVSQLRLSVPDYAHGIWRVAMPFSPGESRLPDDHRARFAALREQAVNGAQLDLAHVVAAIDVHQNIDLIRDSYASWAGDLGTHVLTNLVRQAQSDVGAPDSMAGLADLQGDIDGDNIARHMPAEAPVAAIVAYYEGDGTLMDGVTVGSRYHTFARDQGLLDSSGIFSADVQEARRALRRQTEEFIELDEISLDSRHPFRLLKALFDGHRHEQIENLLDASLDQFLAIIAAGVARESGLS